jgi:selenocysteine lyase/cysteine desulfurase
MHVAVAVEDIRREFAGLTGRTYLNTGGLGLLPNGSRALIRDEYAAFGDTIDPWAWYKQCLERAPGVRATIARFVGADPDEIALKTSVADGYGSVLWGLEWQPGDEIIVTNEEHPTGRQAVELAARQFDLTVKVAPIGRGGDELFETVRQLIGPRTRVLALSHVTTDTGTSLPVRAISRLAHAQGALVLLDGAHTFGQVPLDLHALECDYFAAMGYKWAMGPSGSGFLYLRRESQAVLRSIIGAGGSRWIDLPGGKFEEAASAERFEFTSRPWIEYFALARSLEFLEAVGVAEIQRHVQGLMRSFRAQLREIPGAEIYTPDEQDPPTGIITIGVTGVGGRDLSDRLLARNIIQRAAMMASPQGGVRISFALYTTPEEVDRLVRAIREIARAAGR